MSAILETRQRGTFAALAAIFVAFAAAAAAPSPLYVVYQQQWSFSAGTLTAVFAVFVLTGVPSIKQLGLAVADAVKAGKRLPVLAAGIRQKIRRQPVDVVHDDVLVA